jgi:hypothetical protein
MNRAIAPLLAMALLTSACQSQDSTIVEVSSPAHEPEVGDKSVALSTFVRDFPFATFVPDTSAIGLEKTVSGEYRFSTESTGWQVSGSASNRIHISAPGNMGASIAVRAVTDATSLVVRTLDCTFTRGFVVRLDNVRLPGGRGMTREVSLVFPARNPQIVETRYYYTLDSDTFELEPDDQVCVTVVFEFPERASANEVRELVLKHYGTFASVCRTVRSLSEVDDPR